MSQRPAPRRTVASPALNAITRTSTRSSAPARSVRGTQSLGPKPTESGCSGAELEFMRAMQAYKVSSGRMFPTWSEVLEVLKGLGYAKTS